MISRYWNLFLLLASHLVLAGLLGLVYRVLGRNPIAGHFSLFWALQAAFLISGFCALGAGVYGPQWLGSFGVSALLATSTVFLFAAGVSSRRKRMPLRSFAALSAGLTLFQWLSPHAGGLLGLAVPEPGAVIATHFLTRAAAFGYFAAGVFRNSRRGAINFTTGIAAVLLAVHHTAFGLSAANLGPYSGISSVPATVVGVALNVAIGLSIVVGILDHAIHESTRADESERRFRDVLENLPAACVILNTAGRVTFANESLSRISGYTPEEIIGADWFERFLPEPERNRLRPLYRRAVAEGRITGSRENPILTKSGTPRHLAWTNTLLYSGNGTVSGCASVGFDLTEHRELEVQLRQSQKMESIGRVAGSVAHDFNNLLTVINGYSDLAIAGLENGHPLSRAVREIRRAGQHAADLTTQLLSFSRKDDVRTQIVCVNGLIEQNEALLRRMAGTACEVLIDLDPQLPAIRIEPGLLLQALMNLVSNAGDAMPGGGKLTVRTAFRDGEAACKQCAAANAPAGWIQISVQDTGHGMSQETLERVFEPFFTTKPAGKGTGLGLSTVYNAVQRSGGHLLVESQLSIGSKFAMHLPVSERQEPAAGT